jgi:hypothetical protein
VSHCQLLSQLNRVGQNRIFAGHDPELSQWDETADEPHVPLSHRFSRLGFVSRAPDSGSAALAPLLLRQGPGRVEPMFPARPARPRQPFDDARSGTSTAVYTASAGYAYHLKLECSDRSRLTISCQDCSVLRFTILNAHGGPRPGENGSMCLTLLGSPFRHIEWLLIDHVLVEDPKLSVGRVIRTTELGFQVEENRSNQTALVERRSR